MCLSYTCIMYLGMSVCIWIVYGRITFLWYITNAWTTAFTIKTIFNVYVFTSVAMVILNLYAYTYTRTYILSVCAA